MKQTISYILADPTGNLTCLALDPVDKADRPAVTARLMGECEQVGYLMAPRDPKAQIRLEMMGGEFCGNASMAAATWVAERMHTEVGDSRQLLLEVSGAEGLVPCRITREEGAWSGDVDMPVPTGVETREMLGRQVDIVYLPGIAHLVYAGGDLPKTEAEALLEAAKELLPEQPALGVLIFDEKEKTMAPLVWVRDSDTQVWETSCGSGTIAVAYRWAARQGRTVSINVYQPGGAPRAEIQWENGRATRAILSGRVVLGKPKILSCG